MGGRNFARPKLESLERMSDLKKVTTIDGINQLCEEFNLPLITSIHELSKPLDDMENELLTYTLFGVERPILNQYIENLKEFLMEIRKQ